MGKEYSIAEARSMFPTVIKESEKFDVTVTRRGKPVAAIISIEEYLRYKKKKLDFWTQYEAFKTDEDSSVVLTGEEFVGLRDSSAGRDGDVWD